MSKQLTRSEYAKYKGVSKAMVSKWINDDRIVLTLDDKFVMVEESDARIKLTASLNGSFYERKAKEEKEKINKIIEEKGLTELSEEVNHRKLDLETEDADVLFKNARALREKATALQAKLDYEVNSGLLVEKLVVDKIIFERARQMRDGMMVCSRRIAPEIAGKTDITEIEGVIAREFRALLESFSKLPVIE